MRGLLQQFLAMDNYAGYIVASFTLTVLVLALNVYLAARRDQSIRRDLKRRFSTEQAPPSPIMLDKDSL